MEEFKAVIFERLAHVLLKKYNMILCTVETGIEILYISGS